MSTFRVDDVRAALPIVQPMTRRLRRGVFVTAVYADAVVFTRLRSWKGLAAPVYRSDGAEALADARCRSRPAIVRLADIRRLTITPLRRRSPVRKVRIDIQTSDGVRAVRTWLPAHDAIYGVFESLLGERFVISGARLDARLVISLLFVLVVSLIQVFVVWAFSAADPGAWVPYLVMYPGAALFYAAVRLTGSGHVGTEPPRRPGERLVAKREPFRSRAWGIVLRTVGFVLAGAGLAATFLWNGLLHDTETRGLYAFAPVVPLLMWPGACLLHLGYRMSRASAKMAEPTRAPVVYLRSFLDDAWHTLNRRGFTAQFMGIEPPRLFADMRPPWRYIGNTHPARLVRLLFGWGEDSSEEQLGRYVRRHAPFVAIGKPGEALATPGADRMYVDDERWRVVVREMLLVARAVVLQPGASQGIWWEIGETFRLCKREQVLIVLTALRTPAAYRMFRVRFGVETGILLPEHAGDAPFIIFDAEGVPHLLCASHRSAFTWLFRAGTINLRRTLRPFQHVLKRTNAPLPASQPDAATPPGSVTPPRLRPARLQQVAAVVSVLATPPLVGFMITEGADGPIDLSRDIVRKIARRFAPTEADVPARAAPPAPPALTTVLYRGQRAGYSVLVPPGWHGIARGPSDSFDLGVGVRDTLQVYFWVEGGAGDPPSSIGAGEVESWSTERLRVSGYRVVNVIASGVDEVAGLQYAWAEVHSEFDGRKDTLLTCVFPTDWGLLRLECWGEQPAWSQNDRLSALQLIAGVRLESTELSGSETAPAQEDERGIKPSPR